MQPPPQQRSLGQAIVTALVLVALIVVAYLLGRNAFFVLAFTVVLLALFELLDALVQSGSKPSIPFGLLGGAAMLVVAFLQRPAFFALVLAGTTYGAFLLAMRPGRGERAASDAAWTILGVAWIGGGGAAAVSILMYGGRVWLIGFVLVVALTDIAAYLVGTNVGRHKLAPSLSPHKSWEGFVAGIFGGLCGGAIFGTVMYRMGILQGLGIGLACALLAPVGDLVESLVKREIGIKDSGRILPGHGGFLDRLDAIIFCAPAAFIYLRFIVF